MGVIEEGKDEAGLPLHFVRLNDGRKICYQESGASGSAAERQVLVLHGLGSSRLAGMPGVSPALLSAYRVRLIAIDRPGYGRSDIDKKLTLESITKDIVDVADTLQMGAKFYLLGYSGSGVSCWACARYIPDRIEGIIGWAPLGNFYWKGITKKDRKEWWKTCCRNTGLFFGVVGRNIPRFLLHFYCRYLLRPGPPFMNELKKSLSEPDFKHMTTKADVEDGTIKDSNEALTWNKGYGLYQDLVVWNRNWGFEPEDVAKVYKGKYHIWQGTADALVPFGLQRWIKDKVPELVEMHELPMKAICRGFATTTRHTSKFSRLFLVSLLK